MRTRTLAYSLVRLFACTPPAITSTKQTQELHQPSKSCITGSGLGTFSATPESCLYLVDGCSSDISRHAQLTPSHLFTMAYSTLWKKLSATQLNIAIQVFSLIAIFFEGYDQGVMGGVNASPDYVREVKIGRDDGTITNETKMGGIVSVVC